MGHQLVAALLQRVLKAGCRTHKFTGSKWTRGGRRKTLRRARLIKVEETV